MKINRYIKGASAAAALLLAGAGAAALSGCDAINDDLPPCPEGVALSFRYEYNMEFANAFPAQVDCLTLLVYDEEGKNIATRTETTSVLADEHYRMVLDLPAGHTYSFVAYGGIACPDASFHFAATPGEGSDMTALRVAMDPTFIDAVPGRDLHPLFYGRKSTVVRKGALDYTNDTVYMLKDTNTIRVILQNVDGTPVDPAEFNFTLTANNTLMAWDNALIPTVNPNTYVPFGTGQVSSGTDPENASQEVVLGWADFSTGRLVKGERVRLLITRADNGETVLDIPLINYLLLCRAQHLAQMDDQEFLDRESRWNLMLFLDNGRWINTRIVVNDWDVRINDAEI